MPYLSQNGQVMDARSPWRLSIVPEMFWGVVNFVVLFFRTMFSPELTSRGSGYTTDYRQGLTSGRGGGGPGGPPPPPRRRMGGFAGRGSGPSPPPAAGGG